MAAGGYGAIAASANYAPTLVREVVDAARKGLEKAADAQERLAGLSRLVDTRGVPGVKLAAEIAGLHPGLPRLPLQRLLPLPCQPRCVVVLSLPPRLLGNPCLSQAP